MIDDAFGHWLAGFIDGEGHFAIRRDKSGHFSCAFQLALRCDDEAILREIHERTGLGTLGRRLTGGRSRAQAVWRVSSKGDCLALSGLLQRFPLRAKKAYDLDIWSRAVDLWHGIDPAQFMPPHAEWQSLKVGIENGRRGGHRDPRTPLRGPR